MYSDALINCSSLVRLSFVGLIFRAPDREPSRVEGEIFSFSTVPTIVPLTEQRRGKVSWPGLLSLHLVSLFYAGQ